jgi:hypothetical protein
MSLTTYCHDTFVDYDIFVDYHTNVDYDVSGAPHGIPVSCRRNGCLRRWKTTIPLMRAFHVEDALSRTMSYDDV